MKRRNATRNALFMSIISLMLCVSMLVGTTFAWFTDSVESGRNVIAAGNLDVELFHDDKETKDYTKVDGNTTLFDDVKPNLWEPGAVAYENLQVKNVGTLALKYNLDLTVLEETEVNGHKLSEVIKVGIVKGGVKSTDRDAVIKEVTTWTALADFSLSMNGMELAAKTDAEAFGIVLYWQPNDNEIDNLYNLNNGQEGTLKLDIGVNLYATQLEAESDSFGNDYDEDADLGNVWNPEDDATVPDPEENEDGTKVLTINTAGELAAFAEAVNGGNTYAGVTVVLNSDINLNNNAWTPIGQNGDKAGFQGTFDGQGHTIYNLYVNQTSRAYQSAGLFGSASNATIKNFKIVNATINNLDDAGNTSNGAAVVVGAAQYATTIDNVDVENANVTGNRRVAAIAGYYVGTITNCDVKNVNLTANFDALSDGSYDNADKVGMIIAYSNGASTISNNTVTGCSISGYRDMGGIAGYATTSTLAGNKVSDLDIFVNNAQNYKSYADLDAHDAGEIIGEGTADATNVATNVTIIRGKEIAEGVIESGTRNYYITSPEGLVNVTNIIPQNKEQSQSINLTCDLDMTDIDWKPMNNMHLTFNGNGYTISNLTAGLDSAGRRSGLFGYAGGVTINDLTLKNVNVTGSQAGIFAGSAEGLKVNNCYLKGDNTVNFVAGVETWNGIGAITGVISSSTIDATITEGTTVTLNKTGFTTDAGCTYYDNLTGYLSANAGNVTNKGTVTVIELVEIADGLMQNKDTTTYSVSNANGLAKLNEMMANKTAGRDVVVNLTDDINFEGKTWTPVDSHADTAFEIAEINGNGHTIYNLTINGQAMFRRFAGSGDVVIKDITFDNATVNSNGTINTSILTVQSYQNVLLDNVDVKNSTITGGYKVAPLIATVYNENPNTTITATLKNCDVENVVVTATTYDFCTTGMIAFVYEGNNDTVKFENCTVSNVQLKAKPNGYESHAWIYVNDAETDDCFNEALGVTVTNCTFEAI